MDLTMTERYWIKYATNWKVVGWSPDEVTEFFSINLILPATHGHRRYSASNRHEYQ
jgi:hypothetical protein